VSSSASLSRYAAVDEPDLVVFEPSTCGGFTTIRHVQKEMQFGIVAAIGESEQESVLSALMEFPLTYVVLPTTREALLPAMHAAIARRNHQAEWCGMNERLRKQLDDRKIIERAKGQLMRRFSWTERDAFRRLQQSAMNQRTSMAELAEAVLNGSSVL
jgi:response regulator NasT